MSLDVYLKQATFVTGKCSHCKQDVSLPASKEIVYEANVTHNLTDMATVAGLYGPVWRPEENGVTVASQLIPILRDGISTLKMNPGKHEAFDPSNGFGAYAGFVPWLERYLGACERYPDALVEVSR